jgi:hypothetical protein
MAGKPSDPNRLLVALQEAWVAAVGRHQRDDIIRFSSGGPAGNALLTAWTGLLLLVLFLAELATLISLGIFLPVHIVVGVVLVALVLVKTATTGWRVVRYYSADPAYRAACPPPLLLRALGPAVVAGSLAVLGSGLALIALGNGAHATLVTVLGFRVDAVTVHQACFVGWAVVAGLHALGRVVPAVKLAGTDLTRRRVVPGTRRRAAALGVALAVGLVSGGTVLNAAGAWTHHGIGIDFDHDHDHDITLG